MRAATDAAVARLTAVGVQRVYKVGAVPSNPVTPYAVVSVDSGLARNYRLGSDTRSDLHNIAVQVVGKTYDEAAWTAEKADAAFVRHRLTVAGHDTSPARRDLAAQIQRDPDGGVLMYGLHVYTFTATETE